MPNIESLREEIDVAVQRWLTANNVNGDIQADLNYSGFDESISGLLEEAKALAERDKLKAEQLEILQNIQGSGYNVVTCPNCGGVFLHNDKVLALTCPHCMKKDMDFCDCPDLWY